MGHEAGPTSSCVSAPVTERPFGIGPPGKGALVVDLGHGGHGVLGSRSGFHPSTALFDDVQGLISRSGQQVGLGRGLQRGRRRDLHCLRAGQGALA